MRKIPLKKIVSIIVLVVLSFSFAGNISAYMTLEQQLEIAKRRQRESRSALAREKQNLLVLNKDYSDNSKHLIDIDQQITEVSAELIRTELEIETTNHHITSVREKLSVIGENIDEKRGRVTNLIKFVREISGKRFVDYVFSSTEFSELVTRKSSINKLIDGVIIAVNDLREESASQFQNQINLENKEIRLSELQEKLKKEKNDLALLQSKYKSVLNTISAEITESKEKKIYYNSQLNKYDREIDATFKAIEERNRRLRTDGKFIWPIPGRVSSEYGMRYHPIFKEWRMHTGIDIPASMGTPINASANGVVEICRWYGGYGYCVIVNHGVDDSGKAFATLYGHMSRFGTTKGASVKRGEVIGYIGSTGWSTGPHIHFEVRVNGEHKNPRDYLPEK
jgi:murein DD-endopeptidase MepM/ murein hydrolase activator NlpD